MHVRRDSTAPSRGGCRGTRHEVVRGATSKLSGSGVRSLCQQRYYDSVPTASVHTNFKASSSTCHQHAMCGHTGARQRAHRFAGRGAGREDIVHQHYLDVRAAQQGEQRIAGGADAVAEVAPPVERAQTDRIAHAWPGGQHGSATAIGQPTGSHPRCSGDRVATAPPGGYPPARRRHQQQRTVAGPQPIQAPRQRQSERRRQIATPPFLGRQHRPPRRTRVRPQRPARHTRIGARPHAPRRPRQTTRTARAPSGAGYPASPTCLRQDQIQQRSHRPSVPVTTDRILTPAAPGPRSRRAASPHARSARGPARRTAAASPRANRRCTGCRARR